MGKSRGLSTSSSNREKFRLTMKTVRPGVKKTEYAVRGKTLLEAAKLEAEVCHYCIVQLWLCTLGQDYTSCLGTVIYLVRKKTDSAVTNGEPSESVTKKVAHSHMFIDIEKHLWPF